MSMGDKGRLRYGLIGYPIGHSQSPALFRAYAPQRAYADYELFPLEGIEALPTLIREHSPHGLNVTTPHKEAVLQHLPEIRLSPEVERIGAANVLAFDYEAWDMGASPLPPCWAYNTDVCGFRESLRPLLSAKSYGEAFVLGTGGAARAVAVALEELGFSGQYSFVSRSPETAERTLRAFATEAKPCPVLSYEALSERLSEGQIIINATPLGLTETIAPQLAYDRLNSTHLCYDLVYKDGVTPFLQAASEAGAVCTNGAEMLRLQAEAAWAIWLAHEPMSSKL